LSPHCEGTSSLISTKKECIWGSCELIELHYVLILIGDSFTLMIVDFETPVLAFQCCWIMNKQYLRSVGVIRFCRDDLCNRI
jgi:hypothetical protein